LGKYFEYSSEEVNEVRAASGIARFERVRLVADVLYLMEFSPSHLYFLSCTPASSELT
jgi:hypothetical protein